MAGACLGYFGVVLERINQYNQLDQIKDAPLQISNKGVRVHLNTELCSLGWHELKYALVNKDTLKLVFFAEQKRKTLHLTLARLDTPPPEELQELFDHYQKKYWQQQQ